MPSAPELGGFLPFAEFPSGFTGDAGEHVPCSPAAGRHSLRAHLASFFSPPSPQDDRSKEEELCFSSGAL